MPEQGFAGDGKQPPLLKPGVRLCGHRAAVTELEWAIAAFSCYQEKRDGYDSKVAGVERASYEEGNEASCSVRRDIYWIICVSTSLHGAIITASLDPDLFGNLNQRDTNFPDLGCGPTAATNSLAFLSEEISQIL